MFPPLPDRRAHASMAPPYRRPTLMQPPPEDARDAAVMLLVHPTNAGQSVSALLDWEVLLIRRACYPGVHSGQIALPGGRIEPEDTSLWMTAQRETREEVGVAEERISPLGALTTLYVPPSHTLIHPFLALDTGPATYQIGPHEVQDCRNLPIRTFNPALAQWTTPDVASGALDTVPAWCCDAYVIWGATAMILAELFQIVVNGQLQAITSEL